MLNQNFNNDNLDCFEVYPLEDATHLLTVCSEGGHGFWHWTLTNINTGAVLAQSEAPLYHWCDAVDAGTHSLIDMLELGS